MKKILFLFAAFLCLTCTVRAAYYTDSETGFRFFINSNNEAILQKVPEDVNNVVIPSEIIYNSKTYPVTKIANDTFLSREVIPSLTIPASINFIEYNVFYNKTVQNLYIESLEAWCKTEFEFFANIGNTSSSYREYDYANPISAETRVYIEGKEINGTLTIPSEIKSISDYAFKELNISTLIISEGVETIGLYAFKLCDNVETLYLPSSIKSMLTGLGNKLKEVYIPSMEVWLGMDKFAFGTDYTLYINNVPLTEFVSPAGMEKIPSAAFSGCGLTSVILNEGLKEIGSVAFSNCRINTINLPESLQTIEAGAFYNCPIQSVVFPNGLTSIGARAFANSQCEIITLPETIEKIGVNAFANTPLNRINISSIDTWCNIKLGYTFDYYDYPFYENMPFNSKYQLFVDDQPLDEIVIPSEITKIEVFAFYNCQFTSLTIPEMVTNIGPHAFDGCDALETLNISEEGERLYLCRFAFHGCGLKSLNLPGRCRFDTNLGLAHVFADCSDLESVELGEGFSGLDDYIFENCISLKEIKFPSTLKYAYYAFLDCVSLPEIIFPEGCKTVYHSLGGCRELEYISYPSSITSVDEYYTDCNSLKVIEVKAVNVPASYYATIDSQVAANCTLYVPVESVEAYKDDPYWGQFQHIIGKDFSNPSGVENINVINDQDENIIYNLNGQRVNPDKLMPGIYIRNGKKEVIK